MTIQQETPASAQGRPKRTRRLLQFLMGLIYLLAAIALAGMAVLIMVWSVYQVFDHIVSIWHVHAAGSGTPGKSFIGTMLQSVGVVIIAVAILDVAKYMIEEEVLRKKELRSAREARETLTKITVIIAIAVSIEGIIYIFKAGASDISLLIYPASLIFVATLLMVGLGIYQKLSVSVEDRD
jgi:hypothetical protein